MRMIYAYALLGISTLLHAGPTVTFTSGPNQVALIELFTSEGCRSCPPPERWLSARADDPGLWRTYVTISWHVDYWNGLGWKYRFSSRAFTDRQYAYAKAWNSESVYTPCFVRDGREWRVTNSAIETGPAAGTLTVHYEGSVVRTEFAAAGKAAPQGSLEVHVVLLGGGIRSKVTAGENRGETLTHEFVGLAEVSGGLGASLALPRHAVDGVTRYALAAWITRSGSLDPLQAVGGWLPDADRR